MNVKTWIPLILAIVLGIVAAKAAHDWMLKNKAVATAPGKFVKVVVAKGDTPAGKELTADDLTFAEMEGTAVPGTAFKSSEELVGRVCEASTVKGQTFVEGMLAPKGSGSGLQALIPPNMRAITVEVNEFSGVAGLVAPGCHVDILSTMQGSDSGQVTKTIVQNVKITAVGQRTSAPPADQPPGGPNEMFHSVTVLCKLDEAEAIELACSTGRPRLVLRGGRDNAIVASAGISLGELRGDGKHPTSQPSVALDPTPEIDPSTTKPSMAIAIAKEPPHRTIKVIRGGAESTVTLQVLDGVQPDSIGTTSDPFDSK